MVSDGTMKLVKVVKGGRDPQKRNSRPISGAKSGAFFVTPKPQLTLSTMFLLRLYCTSPMIDCLSCSPSNASATSQFGERRLMYSTAHSPNSKSPSLGV